MNISLLDYLELTKELMLVVGYTEDQVNTYMKNLQYKNIKLDDLTANVAVQCFIQKHSSANADVVRTYLIERKELGKVEFAK